MKKGQVYEGVVERVDFPNLGKVSIAGEEKRLVVKNVIPGQRVQVVCQKVRDEQAKGRLLEVLQHSPLETRKPVCSIFPACGGCMYQTMSYDSQLDMKEQQVKDILNQVVDGDYLFEGILPSPKKFAYRNKMEFSFGDDHKDGPLTLGLHKKSSTYDILTADDCKLAHIDMTDVLTCVLAYFQEKKVGYYKKMQHTGFLRHLLLRRGENTGDLLVNLVTTGQEEHDLKPLVDRLLALPLEGRIVGVIHILNDALSDVVQCDAMELLFGRAYLMERLLGLSFKITPFSFFQPNTKGAEIIYRKVQEYLGDVQGQVVYDLFSGTGTISQVLAKKARKVYGIEIVEEAVLAARENAKENGLDNCIFIAGDVFEQLEEILEKPDVLVLDPPRDGIHPKALPKIINIGCDRIVYVSCKVTSLARDLEGLQAAGYRVEKLCLVDQFCHTVHIECVTLLTRSEATQ
ncbi:MAG: 23S rRNA (uracil(1939)-C(5))-methyltransferase RlmD [Lachnospiraceae bacterium]|nr:23S rRNA (uracil(1939)-C(5))-methyltransferase RlmD [Lachnospiraceae bacterium]